MKRLQLQLLGTDGSFSTIKVTLDPVTLQLVQLAGQFIIKYYVNVSLESSSNHVMLSSEYIV